MRQRDELEGEGWRRRHHGVKKFFLSLCNSLVRERMVEVERRRFRRRGDE